MLWPIVPLILHVISKSLSLSDAGACQGRGALCTESWCEECTTSIESKCSNLAFSNPHGDLCGCCHSCVLIRVLGESCGSQLSVRPTNEESSSSSKVTILATISCDRGLVCVDSICRDLEENAAKDPEERMDYVVGKKETESSGSSREDSTSSTDAEYSQHRHQHQRVDDDEHRLRVEIAKKLKSVATEERQSAHEVEEKIVEKLKNSIVKESGIRTSLEGSDDHRYEDPDRSVVYSSGSKRSELTAVTGSTVKATESFKRHRRNGYHNRYYQQRIEDRVSPIVTNEQSIVFSVEMPKVGEPEDWKVTERHETMTVVPEAIQTRPSYSLTEKTQTIYPAENRLGNIICVQIKNQTFELIFKYDALYELDLLLRSIYKSNSSYHVTKEKADLLHVLFKDRLKKGLQKGSPRSSLLQASRLLTTGNYENYTVIRKTYYKIIRLPEEYQLKSSRAVPSTKNSSVFANGTTLKRAIISSLSQARKPSRSALLNQKITRKTPDKTEAFQDVESLAIHRNLALPNTSKSSRSSVQNRSVRKKRDVEDEEVEDELEEVKLNVPRNIQDILNVKVTRHNADYSDEMPYDILNTTSKKSANVSEVERTNLSENDQNHEEEDQRIERKKIRMREQEDEALRVIDEQLDHEDVESVVDNRVTGASKRTKTLVDLVDAAEERRKRADILDNMKMLFLERGNNDSSVLERNTKRQNNKNDENATSLKYMKSQGMSSTERETFDRSSSVSRSSERERETGKDTTKKGVRSAVNNRVAIKGRTSAPTAAKNNGLADVKEQVRKMKTQVIGLETKLKDTTKSKTQIDQLVKRIEVLERTVEIAETMTSTFLKLLEGEKSIHVPTHRSGIESLEVAPMYRWNSKYSDRARVDDEDDGQSILESQFEPMETEVFVDDRFDNHRAPNVSHGYTRRNEEGKRGQSVMENFEENSLKCNGKVARVDGKNNNAKSIDVKKALEDVTWNLQSERGQLRERRPVFRQEQEKSRHYEDVMAMKELERQVEPSATGSASFHLLPKNSDVSSRGAFAVRRPVRLSTRLTSGDPITETALQNRPVQHQIWSSGSIWNRPLDRSKRRSKEVVAHQVKKHVETQIPKPKVQSVSSENEERSRSTRRTQDQLAREILPDSGNDKLKLFSSDRTSSSLPSTLTTKAQRKREDSTQSWKRIPEDDVSAWRTFVEDRGEDSSRSRTLSKDLVLPMENSSENYGQESRLDQIWITTVPPHFDYFQGQRYSDVNHVSHSIRDDESKSAHDFRLNGQFPLTTRATLRRKSHAEDNISRVQVERNDTAWSKEPSDIVSLSSDSFAEIGLRFDSFGNAYYPEERNVEVETQDHLQQRQRKLAAWKNDTVRNGRAIGTKNWTRATEEYYDRLQKNESDTTKIRFSKETGFDDAGNLTDVNLFTREAPSDLEKYTFMGILQEEMKTNPKKLFNNDNKPIRGSTRNNGPTSNELFEIHSNKSMFDSLSENSKSNFGSRVNDGDEYQNGMTYSTKTSNNSNIQVEIKNVSLIDREFKLQRVGTTEKPAEFRSTLVFMVPDEDFEHMYESIEAEDGDFDYTDLNFTNNNRFDEIEYIDGSNVEMITVMPLSSDYVAIGERVKRQDQDLPLVFENCGSSNCEEKKRKDYRARSKVDVRSDEDDKSFSKLINVVDDVEERKKLKNRNKDSHENVSSMPTYDYHNSVEQNSSFLKKIKSDPVYLATAMPLLGSDNPIKVSLNLKSADTSRRSKDRDNEQKNGDNPDEGKANLNLEDLEDLEGRKGNNRKVSKREASLVLFRIIEQQNRKVLIGPKKTEIWRSTETLKKPAERDTKSEREISKNTRNSTRSSSTSIDETTGNSESNVIPRRDLVKWHVSPEETTEESTSDDKK